MKCDLCGKEFATDAALAQHAKDKHGSEATPPRGSEKGAARKPRSLRRRNRHPVAIGIGAVGLVVVVGLYLLAAPSLAPTPVPCSSGAEWTHVHPYLSISVEGTSVPVPNGVGLLKNGSCLEEVHTHDGSGIIHIELAQSDVNANYSLGDFFRVWNATFPTVTISGTTHPVTFSNNEVFGYRADATHRVVVLVDGKAVTDGARVPLEQLDYCAAADTAPPCSPTATGDPIWNGQTAGYPYGTHHTIVVEYTST